MPYVHDLTHSASPIPVVRIEQGDAESEKLKLAFVEKHPILLANRAPLHSHVAIPIGLFLFFSPLCTYVNSFYKDLPANCVKKKKKKKEKNEKVKEKERLRKRGDARIDQ